AGGGKGGGGTGRTTGGGAPRRPGGWLLRAPAGRIGASQRERAEDMTGEGSITAWLGKLTEGDRQAVQPLWRLYFHRLVGLARNKLRDAPRRAADEEDVALSAFDSFCPGAEQGRLPHLADPGGPLGPLPTLPAPHAPHPP